MTLNNNTSPLPFYTDIALQSFRSPWAYGQIYTHIAPASVLLPFQIIRPHSDAVPQYSALLYDKNGVLKVNITHGMLAVGLYLNKFAADGYDVIIYPGTVKLPDTDIPDGIYYMEFSDGENTWYSDAFTVVQNVATGYVKIEWWSQEDQLFDGGRICYKSAGGYRNIIYLCTELAPPTYEFSEEGTDREGYYFPTLQISEKTYRCTALVPEYICDVLRFARLSDYCIVCDTFGRQYPCDSFLMTPNWQPQGYFASVAIEFQTDTIVKKLGAGYIVGQRQDVVSNVAPPGNITDPPPAPDVPGGGGDIETGSEPDPGPETEPDE